jgi:hypothetical protein
MVRQLRAAITQIFLDFSNGRTAQKRVNASRQPAIVIELR